jgi:hypothetical protein
MPTEEWKPIPGYEGLYEISNQGRVRSLGRITDHGQTRQRMCEKLGVVPENDAPVKRVISPRLLKISLSNGYRVAYLCPPGHRRKQTSIYIDRLLAQLWPDQSLDEIAIKKKAATNRPSSRRHKNTDLTDLPGEEWRDVVGYEGLYKVSNLGRIMSLARMVPNRNNHMHYVRACIRECGTDGSGYPKVEFAKDGNTRTILVHRVVAAAFVPNPLGLECVHHIDENKSNPRADNLEWSSRGDNVRDWFDRRSVDVIKRIAEAMGVSEETARKIVYNNN